MMLPNVNVAREDSARHSFVILSDTGKPVQDRLVPVTFAPGFIANSPRVRKVVSHSQNGVLASVCGKICCSFLTALVLLTVISAASIASIVIGSLFLHDCPAQPHIPHMLIALGVVAFLICTLDCVDLVRYRWAKLEARQIGVEVAREYFEPWRVKQPTVFTWSSYLLKILQLVLFIYTCVLVYRIAGSVTYTPEPNASALIQPEGDIGAGEIHHVAEHHYCNPAVYFFSFWLTTVNLILFFLGMLFLICICMFGALAAIVSDA